MRILQFVLLSAMCLYLAQASPIADKDSKEDSIAKMERLEKQEVSSTTAQKDDDIAETTTEKHEIEFEKDDDKVDKEPKKAEKERSTEAAVEPKVVLRADEEPLNVTEWGQNPCENNRNFNYYLAYPNETTRYIQCDPWGTGTIKTCLKGLIWNMWALKCDDAKNIRNSTTFILPHKVFNCSMSGHECLNGGVCTESSLGGDRCVCKPDWTGQACETRVDTSDLTHEILNGTFSIEKFRKHVESLNITIDVADYARYKDILDNVTYVQLNKYLALYKGREVRYDTLFNNLVENILQNIYPDAAFLSAFNSTSVSVVELIQIIPNLMSYSKYSLERYQDVFAKYQQVLNSLVKYLNSMNNKLPNLRAQAIQYSELTSVFMNHTVQQDNNSSASVSEASLFTADTNHHLSEEQIRESLHTQFSATMNVTERLFSGLDKFQNEVMQLVKNNTRDVFSLTLKESKLPGTAEVQDMLDQIVSSGQNIWDSLVNYGFWFVTTVYGGVATQQRA
jgi:hypothetical protein